MGNPTGKETSPPSIMVALMQARNQGSSPAETAKRVVDVLLAKHQGVSSSEKAELVAAATAALELPDSAAQMKGLGVLAFRVAALSPEPKTEPPRPSFADVLRNRAPELAARRAAHEKERVSRGMQHKAGSGAPERQVMICKIPFSELPAVPGAVIRGGKTKSTADDAIDLLARLPVGHSRLGGLPDLPVHQAWPTHMGKRIPFVAQLNLSDLPRTAHGVLPKDGHLFAFALAGDFKRHPSPPVSVFLDRGPAKDLVRQTQLAKDEHWPDWTGQTSYELIPVGASPRHRGVKRIPGGTHHHAGWLFGRMYGLFGTPGGVADEMFADGDDWINLLAFASAGSMRWSDAGYLYLLIRKSALLALDFSNVLAAVRSS